MKLRAGIPVLWNALVSMVLGFLLLRTFLDFQLHDVLARVSDGHFAISSVLLLCALFLFHHVSEDGEEPMVAMVALVVGGTCTWTLMGEPSVGATVFASGCAVLGGYWTWRRARRIRRPASHSGQP